MVFGFSRKNSNGEPRPSKLFAFRRKMHEAVAHIETRPPAAGTPLPSDVNASQYGTYGYHPALYPPHAGYGALHQPSSTHAIQEPEAGGVDDESVGTEECPSPSDHWGMAYASCGKAIRE
jgi:hypothetical protein